MPNKNKVAFRFAERKDTSLILRFIKELAEYEKLSHEVVADEQTLETWIFDKNKAEVLFLLEDGVEKLKAVESELKDVKEWKRNTQTALKRLAARLDKEIAKAQEEEKKIV